MLWLLTNTLVNGNLTTDTNQSPQRVFIHSGELCQRDIETSSEQMQYVHSFKQIIIRVQLCEIILNIDVDVCSGDLPLYLIFSGSYQCNKVVRVYDDRLRSHR